MTFYNNPIERYVMYIAPDETAYEVGVFAEEYPDGRSEMVTGGAHQATDKRKRSYIESAKENNMDGAGEVDRDDVHPGVIDTLQRKLPEDQAP